MKNIRSIKNSPLFILIVLLLGCSNSSTKLFKFRFASAEAVGFIKWVEKDDIISIEFSKISNLNCLEVYQRMTFKKTPSAILIRDNGLWIPFVFFDQAKSAIYGSKETNYNGFVKNKLSIINDTGLVIDQELENLDGENDYFILHFSNELVPISFEKYDGNDYGVIFDNVKEISKLKIPVCNPQ